MKKVFYLLLAACAILFVSCAKEIDNPSNAEIPANGKTITFTASITMPGETKATLEELDIQWVEGDYIGIATDNSADIVAYPVTPDEEDPTRGTITVTAVEGASAYYALFKGSLGHDGGANEVQADDFSDVSFNTSTKTFSGLTVGKQQVAEGSLSSHLWYSNGYPLAMAGKASGTSLVMRPCLALVKIQVAAESVPDDDYIVSETYNNPAYGVDHAHSYSAVRGFDLYQMGSSTIYSSGDYDVQIANDGSLTTTVVNNDNKRAYRQLSQEGKLLPDTDYLMCLIPGGSVSSFKINFLGYADNDGALLWDSTYTMTKSGEISVKPGDYFNFGTLNPLGRKKAKNHLEDDAADAAAAFVPAIDINGEFDDWAGITTLTSDNTGRIREWKFMTDERFVYIYLKLRGEKLAASKNLYIGFDTDIDSSTSNGAYAGDYVGADAVAKIVPISADSPLTFVNGLDPNSHVWSTTYPGTSSTSGTIKCCGYLDTDGEAYVELSIPRDEVGLPAAGTTIAVGCSYEWSLTGYRNVTLDQAASSTVTATITASDQTVGVGETVEIGATTNSSAPITYTSNNTAIATVDADGVITGVAQGSTTITLSVAAVEGAFTAATKDINVTVTAPRVITIDGDMTDWAGITALGSDDPIRIKDWKLITDDDFVYVYVRLVGDRVSTSKNLYIGFDTDNDSSTSNGAYAGDMTGCDAVVKLVPVSSDDPLTFVNGLEPASKIWSTTYPGTSSISGTVRSSGYLDTDDNDAYVELSISRSELGLPADGTTISVGCSYEWTLTGFQEITLGQAVSSTKTATIYASDQTVGVGQTISIGATTNSSAPITYTSNDTSIATVDADGAITGVAVGSTTITLSVAAVEGAFTAATKDINVTVTEAMAIVIDGSFDDWAAIEGGSNGNHGMFKATSDDTYLYFYSWRTTGGRYSEIWNGGGYIYVGFVFDDDTSNDVPEWNGITGYDFLGYINPYGTSNAIIEWPGTSCKPSGYTFANIYCKGAVDEDGAIIEFRIPRADIPDIPTTMITVAAWGNKDLNKVTLNCTL